MELAEHRIDEVLEELEVLVVRANPSGQLPDPFDGVQFRAVRGEEVNSQPALSLGQPLLECSSSVPTGVVYDDYHSVPFSPASRELLEKLKKARGIEFRFGLDDHHPVIGAHGAEESQALASRRVEDDRVRFFWRHPHGAS